MPEDITAFCFDVPQSKGDLSSVVRAAFPPLHFSICLYSPTRPLHPLSAPSLHDTKTQQHQLSLGCAGGTRLLSWLAGNHQEELLGEKEVGKL